MSKNILSKFERLCLRFNPKCLNFQLVSAAKKTGITLLPISCATGGQLQNHCKAWMVFFVLVRIILRIARHSWYSKFSVRIRDNSVMPSASEGAEIKGLIIIIIFFELPERQDFKFVSRPARRAYRKSEEKQWKNWDKPANNVCDFLEIRGARKMDWGYCACGSKY
jgi:hypothetical protein